MLGDFYNLIYICKDQLWQVDKAAAFAISKFVNVLDVDVQIKLM
jgi:hypothetical protein